MGFFDRLFNKEDINSGVDRFRVTEGAFLIDVRTPSEYQTGHIEGSINIPLGDIHYIVEKVPFIEAPLFVYCQSGARSGQATSMIREMGYRDVTNIGGINGYRGSLVR